MGWLADTPRPSGPQCPRRSLTVLASVFSGLMVAAAFADGPDANTSATQLYQHNCYTCHSTGLPGTPQLGVAEDWVPRFEDGREALYKNALEGFIGDSDMLMPPRGGNASLTDDEVRDVVDYMLKSAGLGDAVQ